MTTLPKSWGVPTADNYVGRSSKEDAAYKRKCGFETRRVIPVV